MSGIFISREGRKFGPYSLEQVRQYLESGNLAGSDWAWREGMTDWLPLTEILKPQPEASFHEKHPQEGEGPVLDGDGDLGVSAKPESSFLGSRVEAPKRSAEIVRFDEIGAATWFHSSAEGISTQLTGQELLSRLEAAELDRGGWIWTPGLLDWSPASNAENFVESFDSSRRPPPLPPVRSDADPLVEMKEAARFPLKNLNKVKKAWYLILLNFIPVVGSIVNRGWRLEMISRPADDPIPAPQEIPKLALQGAILWGMYTMYLFPVLLYLLFDSFGWIFDLIGLCEYILGVITSSNPASGLGAFLSDVGMGFVLESGFLLFYPIASWPFYRVAMLRYAKTKKVSVFFDFRENWRIAKSSYPLLMHVYAQNKLLWFFVAFASAIVSLTGVGAILVPALILPWRLLISGSLYRNLSTKLTELGILEPLGEQVVTGSKTSAELKLTGTQTEHPEASTRRRWYVATLGGSTLEVSQEELAARWASGEQEGRIEKGLPDLLWTAGMWRWESPQEALEFLQRLESPRPPERLLDEPSSRSIFQRLRGLPSEIWAEFNPKVLWGDLRFLIFDTKGGDTKGVWKSRLTWFVLIQYVPVIASIINRGWRIDLMRSASVGGLPSRHNLGRHLAEGLLLWGIYLIYLLPFFFLLVLTEFKWVEQIIGLLWWFAQTSMGRAPNHSLAQILGSGFLRFFFESLLHVAYPIVSWPFYRGAMIRYALEDNLKVFWELKKNYRFSKLNFDTLTSVYLAQKTLWAIYALSSAILLATGVGAVLIPGVLSPIRLLTSGVVYLRGLRKAPSMKGFFPA